MSDEDENSLSEGFSASEDEWKPGKDAHGGESSDDDDSDFEEATAASTAAARGGAVRKREPKTKSSSKPQASAAKKRKPMGQSLRTRLYNKYRPPPKTFPSPSSAGGNSNSPSASTSRAAVPKNARTPNEADDDDSDSECSLDNYLVNPNELDLQSSFFDVKVANSSSVRKSKSPTPEFNCNAGIENLSDSGSEDNNDSSIGEGAKSNAFDFRNLLEKAKGLERAKEAIEKHSEDKKQKARNETSSMDNPQLDVQSLLALGESNNKQNRQEEPHEAAADDLGPSRLRKTKSTRVKRHTKTRPVSSAAAIGGGDTDDSDFEEVADEDNSKEGQNGTEQDARVGLPHTGNLEIIVDLPSRQKKKDKMQEDIEMAMRRKLNRNLRERQLLMHKATLLCGLARGLFYNRLLNRTALMQEALKLLPSKNSYPPENGAGIKYLQSFSTWFKTAIKLKSPNLYPEENPKKKSKVKRVLLQQIQQKEARCKQDFVMIFVILLRGMGIQCRLVLNLQPLPLKPAQSDLLSIKLKPTAKPEEKNDKQSKETKKKDASKSNNQSDGHKKANAKGEDKSKAKQATEKSSKKKPMEPADLPKGVDQKTLPKQDSNQDSKESESDKSGRESAAKCPKLNLNKLRLRTNKSQAKNESETQSNGSGCKNDDKVEVTSTSKRTRYATKEASPLIVDPKVQGSDEKYLQGGSKDREPSATEAPMTRSRSRSKTPIPTAIALPSRSKRKSEQTLEEEETKRKPLSKTRSKNKAQDPADLLRESQGLGIRALRSRKQNPDENSNITEPVKKENLKMPQVDHGVFNGAKNGEPSKRVLPQLDGADDSAVSKRRLQLKKLKLQSRSPEEDSDEDFEPSPPKKPKSAPVLPKQVQKVRSDRRVLSTDNETEEESKQANSKKQTAADMWVEVWSEVDRRWICVDLTSGKVDSVESIRKNATSNLSYIFAYQNDLSIKDVTARYCPNWSTMIRKARVDGSWLHRAIAKYRGRRTERDVREDHELRQIHEAKPLPTAIADYKNHPLYVLERHLLKFEGIYPSDAPTLGFIRGEPVYSRDCVHTLHSREIWLKQARVVKLGEQPYKVVKARPKWDKFTQSVIKDQPLEIFGYWQTQDYDPPTAENGIVPRNAYGNVELFKKCMLPKKTVHLRLPGLNRVCKKLGIDCAPAVVGFDFHQGLCHPLLDGFVVCEEFAEVVTEAWHEEQQEVDRKDREKREQRIYGNWKKLIRGLLIRERLKQKYNF